MTRQVTERRGDCGVLVLTSSTGSAAIIHPQRVRGFARFCVSWGSIPIGIYA